MLFGLSCLPFGLSCCVDGRATALIRPVSSRAHLTVRRLTCETASSVSVKQCTKVESVISGVI